MIRFAVTLGLGVFTSLAQQDPGGPGGPPAGLPGRGRPPVDAILKTLDTDGDGELSASELANASESLLKLDKKGVGRLSAEDLVPQPPGPTNRFGATPPPGAKRPVMPLLEALDTDGDGTLTAEEIAKAKDSLLQLDINGDGKLYRDELRPKRKGGRGGPGGPRGPGGPGGPDAPSGPGQPQDQ